MELSIKESRFFVISSVWVLSCLTLIFTLLPPRTFPLVYPPYYPYLDQRVGKMISPQELMMSDIPWAMAWYGHRKCLWLTLNFKEEFYSINDNMKPINAVLLTQNTMDQKLSSRLINGLDRSWGRVVMESIMLGNVPTGFPLKQAWADIFPDHLYLADLPRWKKGEKENK